MAGKKPSENKSFIKTILISLLAIIITALISWGSWVTKCAFSQTSASATVQTFKKEINSNKDYICNKLEKLQNEQILLKTGVNETITIKNEELSRSVSEDISENYTELTNKINQSNQEISDKLNESNQDLVEKINKSNIRLTDKINQSNQEISDKLNESNSKIYQLLLTIKDKL